MYPSSGVSLLHLLPLPHACHATSMPTMSANDNNAGSSDGSPDNPAPAEVAAPDTEGAAMATALEEAMPDAPLHLHAAGAGGGAGAGGTATVGTTAAAEEPRAAAGAGADASPPVVDKARFDAAWSHVVGLDHVRQQLLESVALPIMYPQLFQRHTYRRPRNFLLFGVSHGAHALYVTVWVSTACCLVHCAGPWVRYDVSGHDDFRGVCTPGPPHASA